MERITALTYTVYREQFLLAIRSGSAEKNVRRRVSNLSTVLQEHIVSAVFEISHFTCLTLRSQLILGEDNREFVDVHMVGGLQLIAHKVAHLLPLRL